jgi:hypothetical protein
VYTYYCDESYHHLFYDLSLNLPLALNGITDVGLKELFRKLFFLILKLYSSVFNDFEPNIPEYLAVLHIVYETGTRPMLI